VNAVYNEIEPYACDWIKNLIAAGHVAAGRVERRSIAELGPDDLAGSGQRHFFAGIGVWSYALRLAGWPDDVDVWTGSCPCQPFSSAGRRRGTDDDRHLWPEWRRLIAECRPPVIFGEQVAGGAGLDWIAAVRADLEALGYSVGAADLCAAGVGAPHIRQRLYWVAYAGGERLDRIAVRLRERQPRQAGAETARCGQDGDRLGDSNELTAGFSNELPGAKKGSRQRIVADGHQPAGDDSDRMGGWHDAEWVECADPVIGTVYRPAQPGAFPLAHGAAARVGRLRAYGNAIVPQVAAAFIRAAVEAIRESK